MKATGSFPTTTFRTVITEDIQAEKPIIPVSQWSRERRNSQNRGQDTTYKICRQVADGIFSKETSILCYEEHVANQSASLALINSRLRRATLAMVSFLGHTASQARVLVQLPKPSSSILATIALARLAASTRP